MIEGVGVSAYLGAAAYITSKAYLTDAASILTTEARHAGWIASAVNKGPAWSDAFDIPLDFNSVFSIACERSTSAFTSFFVPYLYYPPRFSHFQRRSSPTAHRRILHCP